MMEKMGRKTGGKRKELKGFLSILPQQIRGSRLAEVGTSGPPYIVPEYEDSKKPEL